MLGYSFANLLAAPLQPAQLAFSHDGNSLYYPVGNRLCIYDLSNNQSLTLPSENRGDVKLVCVHPKDDLIVTIDVDGYGMVIDINKGTILHRMCFKKPSKTKAQWSKNGSVMCASFSPNGNYFAVAIEKVIQIWRLTYSHEQGWLFHLTNQMAGHLAQILTLDWAPNSIFFCTSSKDMTVRMWSAYSIKGFKPLTFVEHRSPLRGAYFSEDMKRIYSVSREGVIISWKWKQAEEDEQSVAKCIRPSYSLKKKEADILNGFETEEDQPPESSEDKEIVEYMNGIWILEHKAYCNQAKSSKISSVSFCKANNLIVIGYTEGVFGLYECPEFNSIYKLGIGAVVDSVACNNTGDWLAIASSQSGQLFVWEWKSETYIMKQQTHQWGVQCVAFSPTHGHSIAFGSNIDKETKVSAHTEQLGIGSRPLVATGGYDGKVKIWDCLSGFCFVTFAEHLSAIMDIVFTPQSNAILTASLDGTIRGYDLQKYRNFRTFAAPSNQIVQFSSISCDNAGEIVAASSFNDDKYTIYLWNIQTGHLLDVLTGHTGPIVGIRFHPHPTKGGILASASWDGTLRIWDVYNTRAGKNQTEPIIHSSQITAFCFEPTGTGQLASSTTNGQILFWDLNSCEMTSMIDALRFIKVGRRMSDRFPANNVHPKRHKEKFGNMAGLRQSKHYTSLSYSPTGRWLLASSKRSPYISIYDVHTKLLIYNFQLTQNRSLDGILIELNSKYMTDIGEPIQNFDISDEENDIDASDLARRKTIHNQSSLPGVKIGENSELSNVRELDVYRIAFSPDGRHWAAATSQGLYVYTMNSKSGYSTTLLQRSSILHLGKFIPQFLTENVTIPNIISSIDNGDYSKSFILALALNNFDLLYYTYERIPYTSISFVVSTVAPPLIPILLNFLKALFDPNQDNKAVQLQHHLEWLQCTITLHMDILQGDAGWKNWMSHQPPINSISEEAIEPQKNPLKDLSEFGGTMDIRSILLVLLSDIQQIHQTLKNLYEPNLHNLQYLVELAQKKKHHQTTNKNSSN